MFKEVSQFIEEIYALVSMKGTPFNEPNLFLPLNGIYFFFERGQKIMIGDREFDRIVRIGINEKPNNFRKRIRGHYKGNIEGSVFRENVGWALLERANKKPKIVYRTKKNYKKQNSGGPIEDLINRYFSKAFTFKVFAIDYQKLAIYERTLIAAFSIYYQYKIWNGEMTLKDWLGYYSYSRKDKIKRSGLWNSEGVILVNSFKPLSFETKFETRILSLSLLHSIRKDLIQNLIQI
ncbi:hypothetical protein DRO69_08490 [Candidatus Bathyarchaeota archaeon]|nr:MAG: hypothetical protein DRO69_08490 [Candidatus Bathyarchaeota archaeon]